MTPAQKLRAAADTIERTATAATRGHWTWSEHHGRDIADEGWSQVDINSTALPRMGIVASTCYPGGPDTDDPQADAAHIALWGPPTALLVARLAREVAETLDLCGITDWGDVTDGEAWSQLTDAICREHGRATAATE